MGSRKGRCAGRPGNPPAGLVAQDRVRETKLLDAAGDLRHLPPDPVMACAEIAKANLFFVSADRQENEVVLDPYSIKNLRLEPL